MNVEEIMRSEVVTARADEKLGDVARRMLEREVSAVPVLEPGSGARLAGMLTDRDICRSAVARGRRLDQLLVSDAMRRPVRWCWPDDSLEAAEAIIRAYGVRRLPVVDRSGDLVGIVSLADLARSALAARPGADTERSRETVETMASRTGPTA